MERTRGKFAGFSKLARTKQLFLHGVELNPYGIAFSNIPIMVLM
jgi:hypothetical protein